MKYKNKTLHILLKKAPFCSKYFNIYRSLLFYIFTFDFKINFIIAYFESFPALFWQRIKKLLHPQK